MANWIKIPLTLPHLDCAYIIPSPKGKRISIYCDDEMCVLEGVDVAECVDKLKAMDDELTFKERIDMIN
jgi:NADH:ubiquinone oxidoreductase subunit E